MDNTNMNNTQPEYSYQPEADMSVGDWIVTLILTCIPVVNFICLIVWAVSGTDTKKSRKNWAIAQLIIMIVLVVISFIFAGCVGASVASLM